jgi:hypothetical protein
VAPARAGEHLQGSKLQARLQRLVPQLDDVHAAGQRRVGEIGEIPAICPGIRAQVQPCIVQPAP